MKKFYLPGFLILLTVSFLFLTSFLIPGSENAQDDQEDEDSWPRKIEFNHTKIVIYQPQPDSLEGNILKGRAAFSMTTETQKEPLFGAMWFESEVEIDRDDRTVEIITTKIPHLRIADVESEQGKKLIGKLQDELDGLDITMSFDRLLASINASEQERKAAMDFNEEPPKIIVEDKPAVLITIAGDPELRELGDTELMKVINTPFFIVLDPKTRLYWLSGANTWFSTADINGDWKGGVKPPVNVLNTYMKDMESKGEKPQDIPPSEDKRIPKIIVATEPSELIVIDGEPLLKALPGNELLYVKNTEDDVFIELDTELYYVILGGRWYRSKELDGPWEFVRPDKLPKSFAGIPSTSEKGHVLTFVPGTCMAKHAVADAQVPQTASIKRDEVSLTVAYDGEPQFKQIGGTSMEYAVNSAEQVLKIDGKYYCCHEAVWFVSDSAAGPWTVCDSVPSTVQSIPPDNPLYNTKYVRVYDSDPDYVYVGYTPEYLGSYPYYGTVVYGTGYCYRPWIGRNFTCFPRFRSWGCHPNYNPWSGWSFGMSWSPFCPNFFIGFNHTSKWFGACGFGWRRNSNFLIHPIIINRPVLSAKTGFRSFHDNIFRHSDAVRSGKAFTVSSRGRGGRGSQLSPVRGVSNDVLSDRQGNVFKKSKDGWETRGSGKWEPTDIRATDSIRRSGSSGRGSGSSSAVIPQRTQTGATPSSRDIDRSGSSGRGSGSSSAVIPQRTQTGATPSTRYIDRSGSLGRGS
ncbi:MAG: hypothetical protein WC637_20860, partial [Victivallales bacterium]